jgi:predicted metal-dependent peptidase
MMAGDYPLHAGLLGSMCLLHEPSVRTMAVCIRDFRITLLYDHRFVANCSLPELQGVLHHEVNHVVLGHLFANLCDFPNRAARIIAEEVTANEFVQEDLPGSPLRLTDFGLPRGESTEVRYHRMVKRCKSAATMPNSWLLSDPRPLDNHDVWLQQDCPPAMRHTIVASTVRAVCNSLPTKNWGLPVWLGEQVEQLCQAAGQKHLDWRVLFRRYVASAVEQRHQFNRPPRRFPEFVGIIPGRCHVPTRQKILAAIDTSGSITNEMLAQISAELAHLNKNGDVTIVECDDQIRAVYPYKPITEVHGRGGTDFRPVFEAKFLAQHRCDVVVYFTDGMGLGPERAPRVPVVWCLVEGGQAVAAWGKTVRLPRDNVKTLSNAPRCSANPFEPGNGQKIWSMSLEADTSRPRSSSATSDCEVP